MIIYFHICQKGDWKRSFTMIFNKIKESGLYDAVDEIRCGIVNDTGTLLSDTLLNDPKINIIHTGYSHEYERPTLLHMKNNAQSNTKYLYCHTKGLQWFGTYNEPFVLDWINLLIYWNIEKWRDAVVELDSYDTYGCNFLKKNVYPDHYSGNFYWVTSNHLSKLNKTIDSQYHAPEFWIFNTTEPYTYCNAYSSGLEAGAHYSTPHPPHLYRVLFIRM
jgi:hypothetical protein